MMIKIIRHKKLKGQNLSTFLYLITAQVILLVMIGMYGTYMAGVNCPDWAAQFSDTPYNNTDITNSVGQVWNFLTVLFSGCSGIPWWVYIIFFAAPIISLIVYVVPFIGD